MARRSVSSRFGLFLEDGRAVINAFVDRRLQDDFPGIPRYLPAKAVGVRIRPDVGVAQCSTCFFIGGAVSLGSPLIGEPCGIGGFVPGDSGVFDRNIPSGLGGLDVFSVSGLGGMESLAPGGLGFLDGLIPNAFGPHGVQTQSGRQPAFPAAASERQARPYDARLERGANEAALIRESLERLAK